MQLPSRMSATWAPRHRRKGTGDGVADERYASFVGLASQPLLLLSRLPRLPTRTRAPRRCRVEIGRPHYVLGRLLWHLHFCCGVCVKKNNP